MDKDRLEKARVNAAEASKYAFAVTKIEELIDKGLIPHTVEISKECQKMMTRAKAHNEVVSFCLHED